MTAQGLVAAASALAVALGATAMPASAAVPATTPAPLRVGVVGLDAVDPADAGGPGSQLLVRTMCDSLLRVDPRTGDLHGGVAVSWLVSDRGQRITLRLRRGVRFADGRAVTADDIVFSLSRAASEAFAGSDAGLLEPIAGFDEIHGDREAKHAQQRRRLAGVRAVSSRGIEITLRRPDAEFLNVLASPVSAPLPRRLAERDPERFRRDPICVGSWRLAHPWTPGQTVTSLTGRRVAIEFHRYDDRAAASAAWSRGEVDVAPMATGPVTGAALADVLEVPGPHIEYAGLPATAPFDRAVVRAALSRSLDRSALAATLDRLPAFGFLTPSTGPAFRSSGCGADVPATADVDGARALLDRAGVDLRGVTLPFLYNDEFDNAQEAAILAQQWHDHLGLDVKPTAAPWATMLRELSAPEPYAGAYRMGWTPPVSGPDAALAPIFASAGDIGTARLSRVTDTGFDRALTHEARTASDRANRRLEYRRLEARLCRSLPLVPLTVSRSRWLVRAAAVPGAAADGGRGRLLDRATGLPVLRAMVQR